MSQLAMVDATDAIQATVADTITNRFDSHAVKHT